MMPFGLKNVGATYQRLISKMFLGLIRVTMEAYIEDMVIKSRKAHDHIRDATEVFEIFRRFKMKLNPLKYAFGVSFGQLFGHIVSRRRIEPSSTQVKTLSQIEEPKIVQMFRASPGKQLC